MKKKMTELEAKIAMQSENMNKISLNSNKNEEKLKNDITDYINQINDLKNEMEVLNNIITNLTEEKENNAIKISNLIHENEKLKQNIKNNNNGMDKDINSPKINENLNNNKKYEEIILKLKKNMLNLKEENKTLEEVILKQESEVNQLSSKVTEVENILIKKDKELQESIEYSAKLTSSINFHKNEIIKIKQKQSQSDNNKNDKNNETIINLQKELQNMKKNLQAKENKLSILSSNNKTLQDKLNKLTQTIKNELNCNNDNNNNKNKNNIYSSHNNYYTNKINISKTQSQLKNKTTRGSDTINPVASHILPKNNIINNNNNNENYKDNHRIIQNDKSPYHKQNIDDKKLYIVSKHKVKSKTPGKLISSKQKLPETKQDLEKQNIEILNKNKKSNKNLDNIYPSIYTKQKNFKDSKNNINEKYKQIESKYKNDIKEITKEDTLFNEDEIKNLNIKKEIITPNIQINEDNDSIPIFNNMNSQTLKPKKEGRNKAGPNNKNNIRDQSIMSQEKEFPIIESYCMLMEKDNQNKSNCITNENNKSKNITIYNDIDKINESIEAKQVQDLKDRVNKILNEF